MASGKPATWQAQRTAILSSWVGFGLTLVLTVVLIIQTTLMPQRVWLYLPPGKTSPATLDSSTVLVSQLFLLIGFGVYAILLVVGTLLWWRARANLRRATGFSSIPLVGVIIGLTLVFFGTLNIVPQASGVPQPFSHAHVVLRNSAVITFVVFLVVIAAVVVGCHLVARRFVPPSAAEQAKDDLADGLSEVSS